jgi:hypothetical protein
MSALRSLTRISMLVAVVLPCGGPLEAGRGSSFHDRALNAYDRGVVQRVRTRTQLLRLCCRAARAHARRRQAQ